MKKFHASCLVILLGLCGCASQVMQGYVGKTLAEPILDYGQPIGAMDMPDGTRAFQWKMQNTQYVPQTTVYNNNTSYNAYGINRNIYGNAVTTGSATTYGGYSINSECTYTLFAKRAGKGNTPSHWIVTGFMSPRLDCE